MSTTIYEELVIDPLRELEQKGHGELFEVSKGVFGIRKGSAGSALIVAGYHANEIFGTYQSMLKLAESSIEAVLIPIIDVPGFCNHKRNWEEQKSLNNGQNAACMYDMIKGEFKQPEKLRWQVGEEDAIPPVKALSCLIEECRLLIDLHNIYSESYSIITNPTRSDRELEYLNRVASKIAEKNKLYDGSLGNNSRMIEKGVFACRSRPTTLSHANDNGIMNMAIEVPVLCNGTEIQDVEFMSAVNAEILEYAVNEQCRIMEDG